MVSVGCWCCMGLGERKGFVMIFDVLDIVEGVSDWQVGSQL